MDKTNKLETRPVGRLLVELSTPAIIAMLINAIYNIVDRIFVGKYVGEQGLAGLTIVFPVMMIIFAFCGLSAIGASVLISISLGQKDKEKASHVLGNSFVLGTILAVVTLASILIFLNPLLYLFGASEDIIGYASSYLRIILLGFLFQMYGFILNNATRAEGRAILSMVSISISGIINIILDYVFIVIMGLGVEGAALATIIGQSFSFIILAFYFATGKMAIKLNLKHFKPDFSIIKKIVSLGLTSSLATLGTSLSAVLLNRSLQKYGGYLSITSMGAVNSLFTLFIMPIFGMQQGMQPIIGYNFGANRKDRSYRALKLTTIFAVCLSTFVFACFEIFPRFFISLFLRSESEAMELSITALRIFVLSLPLLSLNLLGTSFYQSTGKASRALILGLLRQVIFLIPAIFILSAKFGLNGVWLATPVADYIAILATVIIFIYDYKKDHNEDEKIESVEMENKETLIQQ